jgi:hypothetical protein
MLDRMTAMDGTNRHFSAVMHNMVDLLIANVKEAKVAGDASD